MGCCFCHDGPSDLDDIPARGHKHVKSWHDNMSLDQKKKIAKKHQHAECFFCKCCGIFGMWSGLKCCCCSFNPQVPFLSINEDRHCTDIPCCLLLIVTLIAQFGLFITAYNTYNSDPRWLIYYADWEGNLCAPDWEDLPFELTVNSTTGGQFAAWPDIRMYDIRICVEHCNDTLVDDRIVTPSFDADIDFEFDITDTNFIPDLSGYASRNLLNAYCIPAPDAVSEAVSAALEADYSAFEENLDKLTDEVSLAINDVKTAWMLFIICAFSALFVSMFWGWLMRHIGALIIWLSIFLTLFGMFLLAWFLIEYSEYAYLFGYTRLGDLMYYGGWIIGIIDGMFALAVCFMWNRIRLAIALAKETTRALNTLWSLFFYPIVPFIWFSAYMAYWIVTGLYIGSVTNKKTWPFPEGYKLPYYDYGPTLQSALDLPSEGAEYTYLEIDELWQYFCLFHFFVLLWVTHFISYHTYAVIAGVYAEWYFADWKDEKETKKWRGKDEEVLVVDDQAVRNDKDLDKIKAQQQQKHQLGIDQNRKENKPKEEMKRIAKLSICPTFYSFKRVTWYHTGSLAFASLLIAIIEFIEYTLTYFEKKFRTAEPSPLQKAILAAVKCLLKCIKCILNRINRNGLVITSIYGWPFCASSMKGISIILKNVVRAAALDMVSGYLEKLGKLCILSMNVGICLAIARYYYKDALSSILLPAFLCFCITYVICWQYMHLYEVGISTIFICFLIDEERNKSLQEMKASKRLRKIIGAQKPPKKYLREKVKSVLNVGLIDEEQADHFGKNEQFNARDFRVANSVGNLKFDIEELKHGKTDSNSHDLSYSIDKGHQTQIDDYNNDQMGIQDAMQMEMTNRKNKKPNQWGAGGGDSTHL